MAKLSSSRQKAILRKYSDNVKYLMMAGQYLCNRIYPAQTGKVQV